MDTPQYQDHSTADELRQLRRGLGLAAIGWTAIIAASVFWNIRNESRQEIAVATSAARANFDKDQAYRQWATLHGGVYVKPDKRTPRNPYLAHLPHRDVTTTTGVELTLMNPAYMLRQMMQEYGELYGVQGKITGKVVLNPINAPDEWEIMALNAFEAGVEEVVEISEIGGKRYLRLMRPMFMTNEGCVKCHGHLGFKLGDLRGGAACGVCRIDRRFDLGDLDVALRHLVGRSRVAAFCQTSKHAAHAHAASIYFHAADYGPDKGRLSGQHIA